jgi:hypothetical protein
LDKRNRERERGMGEQRRETVNLNTHRSVLFFRGQTNAYIFILAKAQFKARMT